MIEELRTPRGGWTRDVLEKLGVPWPPPKGWKKALMSANKKKKWKILEAARRKAQMPNFPKEDVIRVVCEQMAVQMPASWDARYALMRKWASDYLPLPKALPSKGAVACAQTPPPAPKKIKHRTLNKMATDVFLLSTEWRQLRMRVIVKRGAKCECCGATPKDGITINVDHVKPRKKYPELALDESNLQVLCDVCNHGKGNWDETDWRPEAPRLVKGNTA